MHIGYYKKVRTKWLVFIYAIARGRFLRKLLQKEINQEYKQLDNYASVMAFLSNVGIS